MQTALLRSTFLIAGLAAMLLLPISGAATQTRPTSSPPPAVADRIAAVERVLDLLDTMKAHGIPGISVAVIDNFKIDWAKGYGVTEKDGATAVTPRTLFLAGSISKPVAAVAALTLVERGKLSLAADVNSTLTSWKVPENAFTSQNDVTLGAILDHTGRFSGGDFFPGYAPGMPVPTLVQILDGKQPATNDPVRVAYVPGSKWQYSGNGYLVAQELMMDVTGEPFPQLVRELVFDPLSMRDSTFEQPLAADRGAMAASGTLYNGNPVVGKWHVQPEMGWWPLDDADRPCETCDRDRACDSR